MGWASLEQEICLVLGKFVLYMYLNSSSPCIAHVIVRKYKLGLLFPCEQHVFGEIGFLLPGLEFAAW